MNVNIDWLNLFCIALFNSFLIIGVNRASSFEYCHPDERGEDYCDENGIEEDSKMVLWRFRFWAVESLGTFWSKPLFTCPTCMASVHSTYVYWMFVPFITEAVLFWPLYILFLSGLTTLINSIIK